MDWMPEWMKTEMAQYPALTQAAKELEAAQLAMKETPKTLQTAGYKKRDPLTVEAYVTVSTAAWSQHIAEMKLFAMVTLNELGRLREEIRELKAQR